jgi:hypothetical protein
VLLRHHALGAGECGELAGLVHERDRVVLAGLEQRLERAGVGLAALCREPERAPAQQLRRLRTVGHHPHRARGAQRCQRLPHRLRLGLDQHQARAARGRREPGGERFHALLAPAKILDLQHQRQLPRREQRHVPERGEDLVDVVLAGPHHPRLRRLGHGGGPAAAELGEERGLHRLVGALEIDRGRELSPARPLEQRQRRHGGGRARGSRRGRALHRRGHRGLTSLRRCG